MGGRHRIGGALRRRVCLAKGVAGRRRGRAGRERQERLRDRRTEQGLVNSAVARRPHRVKGNGRAAGINALIGQAKSVGRRGIGQDDVILRGSQGAHLAESDAAGVAQGPVGATGRNGGAINMVACNRVGATLRLRDPVQGEACATWHSRNIRVRHRIIRRR